jgi:hypothetical protein
MNESEISQYITETFEGVAVVFNSADNGFFFFYNPDSNLPPDHRFMFVTLMTTDVDDQFSNLNRPSIFRLNIGISKQTFCSLFGDSPRPSPRESMAEGGNIPDDYDFTVLNQVMPHPVYGRMYWVCVLNPGDETFETKVKPLLAEAYEMAINKCGAVTKL